MKKELIYLLYASTILGFIIFVGSYYFSDKNKKKSYRSISLYDKQILNYSDNLIILKSDTEDIIKFVENTFIKDKKKYKFWELLFDDKK